MPHDDLARDLAHTADVRAASWAVVEHLAGPGLRPSVYLERGGKLRCQALRGYRQLLDGMPPWTGVIGRTYATGVPSVVRDVSSDPNYLPAGADVVAEACFPVSYGRRTVGAVNVEAARALTDAEVAATAAAAAALGTKIEALGGPTPESSSQRLVRHAIALATESDAAAIERAVVAAAVDVTPMSSAMVLRRGSPGDPFVPVRTFGPLKDVLVWSSAETIAELAGFARAGCSLYTVSSAGPDAYESPGIEALRLAGAASMAVLPVGPDRILLVVGEADTGLSTEHCELLELLAAQASACLRTAASVSSLRTQAATDPLTGLGHHATFHAELAEAWASGAVGVLVVDIDAFKDFNDHHGHPAGDRALQATAGALSGALRRGDVLFRIGGDEFAAVLPGVDGEGALHVARRLHRAVADSAPALSVSIGAAVATSAEGVESLLARADRALYAVKDHGRDGVALDPGAPVAPGAAD